MKIRVTWEEKHSIIVEAPNKKAAVELVTETMTVKKVQQDKTYLYEMTSPKGEGVEEEAVAEQAQKAREGLYKTSRDAQ